MDVYVWLPACEPDLLRRFVDRYVDQRAPGDSRLSSFLRAYIERTADDGGAPPFARDTLHDPVK